MAPFGKEFVTTLWVLGIIGLIVIFVVANQDPQPRPSQQPRPGLTAAEATAQPNSGKDYYPSAPVALYGCKEWTKTRSKLGVGEIVDEYEVETKKPLPKDRIKVAIEYRAQGNGLLMISACEYKWVGNLPFLVNATSRPL